MLLLEGLFVEELLLGEELLFLLDRLAEVDGCLVAFYNLKFRFKDLLLALEPI